MSQQFLFVMWAGGGNVPPQLVLAGNLAARGHTVRVLAPAVLRERIEQSGLIFEPYAQAPEHDEGDRQHSLIRDFEARTPIGAVTAARDRLIIGTAAAIAADTRRVVEQHNVDAVVFDYLLIGAAFAAESVGVPCVALVHQTYPFPSPGAPPFGTGWSPARGPLGRLRDAFGNTVFDRMMARPLLAPLNAVRRDLGLRPLAHAVDAFTGTARVLVLTSEAFDFAGDRPDSVVYVGPQLPHGPGLVEPVESPSHDVPLVLVGLSTTYQGQGDLLHRVVRALGTLPVTAIVSTGPVSLAGHDVPDNVEVHRFIPHERVMPAADAVVTHAGHGTVMAALAHGVPLVCLPIARDQPDVAARVAHAGAGIRLSSRSSPPKIAGAITSVLTDGRYREKAARLQASIAADLAAQRGIRELETIAADAQTSAAARTSRR